MVGAVEPTVVGFLPNVEMLRVRARVSFYLPWLKSLSTKGKLWQMIVSQKLRSSCDSSWFRLRSEVTILWDNDVRKLYIDEGPQFTSKEPVFLSTCAFLRSWVSITLCRCIAVLKTTARLWPLWRQWKRSLVDPATTALSIRIKPREYFYSISIHPLLGTSICLDAVHSIRDLQPALHPAHFSYWSK